MCCAKGFGAPAERSDPQSKSKSKGRFNSDLLDAGSSKVRGGAAPITPPPPPPPPAIPALTTAARAHPKQAVEQALDLVDRRSPPVNPGDASRGSVNFVRVKNWGSGRAEDVGELQVESASQAMPADAPLYDQLARRLEALQAEGSLTVARPKGAPPLPPFERWAFAEAHYAQHLADLLCVHCALERAIVAARGALARRGDAAGARLAAAVALFGAERGLARSAQIAADLGRLSPAGAGGEPLAPLPNAAAYGRYIDELAARVARAEGAGEAGPAAAGLLAHAYVVLLTLLTSGARIGAAATERLDLFARGAVATFSSYPPQVAAPLEEFVAAVNAAGAALAPAEREALMGELPPAMQKASLLLDALARER